MAAVFQKKIVQAEVIHWFKDLRYILVTTISGFIMDRRMSTERSHLTSTNAIRLR